MSVTITIEEDDTVNDIDTDCFNEENKPEKENYELNISALLFDCKNSEVFQNNDNDYGIIEEMSLENFIDRIDLPFHGLVGRKPLFSVPGVVEFVENILHLCSLANEKRRTNEIQTVGISMPDLRDHIYANFSEVRDYFPHLCSLTIRRLGIPPNHSRKAAKYYHCVIPMKRFHVNNNRFLFTEHSHSSFSLNNLIYEECVYFQSQGDQIEMFSSDVSQSFNVGGTTLTSRSYFLFFFLFFLLNILGTITIIKFF